jgi:hypothetical protein
MNFLQCCLGESVMASQQKRTKAASLQRNDLANHVSGSGGAPETPFQQKTRREGIDFDYDPKLGKLKITIRHGRYNYEQL